MSRRAAVSAANFLALSSILPFPSSEASAAPPPSALDVVADPDTYSALAYAPPDCDESTPLILVLHGSGKNDQNIRDDLASPVGEHAGLIPSLLESGGTTAPAILRERFCVLAPYSYGQASFYGEPRSKMLRFVDWAIQNQNTKELPIRFDPDKIILLGFSDGATVAVELLTTRRFAAGVICSYGYSGEALPSKALERLSTLPMWVYHSQDDVIFDVQYSDRLVRQLRSVNKNNGSIIRYTRPTTDPEQLPPRIRGHSMGIVASKQPELYEWMLQVTQK
ncbi:MAG: hypothetical protein SGILL_002530 [Bacillariaceae sp.]